MVIAHQVPFRLNRLLSRSLLVGVGAAASVLLGVVPSFHSSSVISFDSISFSNAAYAQSISDQDVLNYARSVLAIEPLRQAAYDDIKSISGSVPRIECHRPSSLNDLPGNIRQIAVNYCNQAIAIVERNDLTITQFNSIRVAQDADSGLLTRIQRAIMQLR
ncbi:MAG: DUF4168 domain-containing protein [Oculatellaceae cyanobacterium Prado106]|jgi:hypothetical protein|nr:DUF4168 domain-containing protein [Oculatellaceae cyanobacterium Prado106]